jgi:hypothetical protein
VNLFLLYEILQISSAAHSRIQNAFSLQFSHIHGHEIPTKHKETIRAFAKVLILASTPLAFSIRRHNTLVNAWGAIGYSYKSPIIFLKKTSKSGAFKQLDY